MSVNTLLAITELGGYPDFTTLYKNTGYDVVKTDNVRKSIKLIRKHKPSVIVSEFNFQSDFRDRTSSLETVLSSTQGVVDDARMIIFYEKEYRHQLDRLLAHFPVFAALSFPIDEQLLAQTLERALQP